MLPLAQKIAFLVFAVVTGAGGVWGFARLYRRIARGRADADLRWDRLGARVWYALTTTLLQTRTFWGHANSTATAFALASVISIVGYNLAPGELPPVPEPRALTSQYRTDPAA